MQSSNPYSSIKIIEDQNSFDALCKKWEAESSIALDTEFMRTSTFYAKMGLLQIADSTSIYLIDPLKVTQWGAFNNLLEDSDCMIVIHSAGEDLNLLLTHCGAVPKKLFDTQLAAAFVGLGFSLSYQALVASQFQIEVEKDETRSDWLQRPLTDKQLQYAANDVAHLIELSRILEEKLKNEGRWAWFEGECHSMVDLARLVEKDSNWNLLYGSISNAWKLSDEGLSLLRDLCYWREAESRKRNRPRSWIIKDGDLFEVAIRCSKVPEITLPFLLSIELQERKFMKRYGNEMLELLNQCQSSESPVDRSLLNLPLDSGARKVLKQMQAVVSDKATQLDLAPELLGRKKFLLELLRDRQHSGEIQWPATRSAWRQSILETEFDQLLKNEEVSNES